MPTSSQRRVVAVTTALVIATALVNVTPANAAPTEAVPAAEQDGLRAVAFDENVARANGYVIVTRPDGFQDSVPKEQAEAARSGLTKPEGALVPTAGREFTTAAQDYKYGNCGWSMVSMSALGGARATMDTGAHVRPDWDGIWDVNWRVNITDNGGSSQQTGYSAPRGTHDFNPAPRTLNLTRGPAVAGVPYYAYVLLEDGTVCFSLAPSVSITIT